MEKPFVIITPESDREALRNCGVLPEGLFRTFDVKSNGLRGDAGDDGLPPVYLWPYELKYDCGSDENQGELYKPDVPGLFGLKPPANAAEKQHNERLITSLLGCVMVHIVFLDKAASEKGYAAFGSFEEIIEWGLSLRRALNVRFRNEKILQAVESVLVIVARGEQVSLRASDVEQFNKCIQQSRSDEFVPDSPSCSEQNQRKIFRSCYFLDYNLCVRDSRELYHSDLIWDVMIGRLLLAFLLSRNDRVRWWQVPGIKLWRTFDCVSEIDAKSDKRLVDEMMAQANRAVQDLVADADALDGLSLMHASPSVKFPMEDKSLEPADSGKTSWREPPPEGWSEYDTKACVENTCGLSRWLPALEDVRRTLPGWKISYGRQADTHDSKAVFRMVHLAPGNLLKIVRGIFSKLQRSSVVDNRDPKRDWSSLVATEQKRVEASKSVKKDAPELEKAQRHYVGFGVSAVIVAAVCATLGASVYYLVHTMCGLFAIKTPDWLISLFFFVFIFIGSVAAAALFFFCHARAGRRALSVLAKESEHVDAMMQERDGMARRLVAHGMLMRDKLVLRAHRFRAWALLKRTQDILLTELQPVVARRIEGNVAGRSSPGQIEQERVRETFLKRTRNSFGPYRITMDEALRMGLDRLVAQWWSENDTGRSVSIADARSFLELWRGLCAEDQELAGYFPARLFAGEIRSFVSRFTNAARMVARGAVVANHVQELRNGLLAWYERLQDDNYYRYASGAVTGEHVNEFWLENARVYFGDSSIVDMDRISRIRVGSQADYSRFMPAFRSELNHTKLLALLFQEMPVKFGSDAEGDEMGHLIFKEISDLAGDQDG